MARYLIYLGAVACLVAGGCGEDSGTGPAKPQVDSGTDASQREDASSEDADAEEQLVLADVEVTVQFEGMAEDASLVVAAFPTRPVQGPPVARRRVEEPSYPQTVTLQSLEAGGGPYHILVIIDRPPPVTTIAGDEDTTTWADPIQIEDAETRELELTVE
jgi:hypothetical protein